jgi:putative ABC transport system permease protein
MSFTLLVKSLLRRKLVVGLLLVQLAVTLALLVNSGLLAVHARSLLNRDTGLDLDNTLIISLRPTSPAMAEEPFLSNLLQRQLDALRRIDGVVTAAYLSQAPLSEGGSNGDIYDLDNKEVARAGVVPFTEASPDIFSALGIKLVAGELPVQLAEVIDFNTVDIKTLDIKKRKVVITESLARHLYPTKSAVGQFTSNGQVVAVVTDFTGQLWADDKNFNAVAIEPLVLDGRMDYLFAVHVRPGMADAVRPQLAGKLRAVDTNIDILYTKTLDEQKHNLYRYPYGLAALLLVLSALMLVVAMISAYSNAFFHALQQHHEIGIKRALGADKKMIFRELLTESWLTTSLGAGLGLVCALLLNRTLAMVLEIPAIPLWLPLVSVALLLICVTLASWYPTRIAVNISPVSATKSI